MDVVNADGHLLDLARDLADAADRHALLERLCAGARAVIPADHASAGLRRSQWDSVEAFVTSGLPSGVGAELRRTLRPEERMPLVLGRRAALRLVNADGRPDRIGLPAFHPPVGALLVVPIASPVHVHGWLTLTNGVPGRAFSAADESVAVTLGVLTGLACDHLNTDGDLRREVDELRADEARTTRLVAARHALEKQYRQALTAEAVRQFAGHVAHDFNNLLATILGYSRFLLAAMEEGEPRRDVAQIDKTAERAATLGRHLLAFSRRQSVDLEILDLNAIVAGAAALIRPMLAGRTDMRIDAAPGLWPVRADRGHLEQVLTSLTSNAGHAMPDGGTLTIATRNVEPAEASGLDMPARAHVMLSVTDTGTGMAEPVRARVFEPFFSTRGVGAGLGLASVEAIVSQSGGEIHVESAPGRGSTFTVLLPRAPDGAAPAVQARPRHRSCPDAATVLLVDDEEGIRELIDDILTRAGYRVLVAGMLPEAVDIFAREAGRIDLLIADVVMPGGTGPELYATLVPERPDLRVLFISGYAEPGLIERAALDGAGFIQKPFTADRLIAAVRALLAR